MKHLDLYRKQPGHVPESVWDMTGLESLNLADNGLTSISTRLGGLRQLQMLDLGHNALDVIPEEIGLLTGLSRFLYLSDNRFQFVPDSLCNLVRFALPQHHGQPTHCAARTNR